MATGGTGRSWLWTLRRNGKPWTQRQVATILQRKTLYRDDVLRYGEVSGHNGQLVLLA